MCRPQGTSTPGGRVLPAGGHPAARPPPRLPAPRRDFSPDSQPSVLTAAQLGFWRLGDKCQNRRLLLAPSCLRGPPGHVSSRPDEEGHLLESPQQPPRRDLVSRAAAEPGRTGGLVPRPAAEEALAITTQGTEGSLPHPGHEAEGAAVWGRQQGPGTCPHDLWPRTSPGGSVDASCSTRKGRLG